VPRSLISNFCKNQPVEEPRALLCTRFTSCPEAFHDGEIPPRRRPAAYDGEEPSQWIVPVKETKRPRQKTTTTKNETAINSQFMHTKHTRI